MRLRTLLISLALTLSAAAARAEVLIFAAASLKEPVDLIAAQFDDVVVSYGGSGTMARQVSFGAPADIVLLANTDWMDVLVAGDHVQAESVFDFASNRLVMIGPEGAGPVPLTSEAILDALEAGRMAVGLTQAVPAGIYAKAALQSLGLWEDLEDKLAEVDNVRAALALVARGQAPLGIVYQSDTRITRDVAQVALFPADSHPPIRYVGALTNDADTAAQDVLTYLRGPEGQAILAEAGLLPPVDDPS
ncbi:molybdate transport system substrate-binding protein [Loktanella sp. PT4BL]|jgi:molybdate transport system substrate-binding protein|uniref:molybdate ABC transporter substrate-binding protein n=1 Tax=Loktanella sp. PT4BL TaxID=2135611 RepID=UPI000D76E6EF|nr:molybdate ABC transporter substrate-binding protein [Loktanella sp. PT4BL]PXW72669.1 molybdate transport system substrate-binding protein [Loktanella sp. PT4BL]